MEKQLKECVYLPISISGLLGITRIHKIGELYVIVLVLYLGFTQGFLEVV